MHCWWHSNSKTLVVDNHEDLSAQVSLLSISDAVSFTTRGSGAIISDNSNENPSEKDRCAHVSPSVSKIVLVCLASWGFIGLCLQVGRYIRLYNAGTADLTVTLSGNECDYGKNIAEAKSMGCVYDALASAWLPPECRDDELTAEFNRSRPGPEGSWLYYADINGTIPITIADIALMGGTLDFWYSTKEWHVVHCNFYWRKLFRMPKTGALMEGRNNKIEHIKHCNEIMLDDLPMDSIAVMARAVLNSA